MKKDEHSLNNRIGTIIADLRISKGYTQKQLAKIFHVSESSMAHYEQGANPAPLSLIIKIADYFNV